MICNLAKCCVQTAQTIISRSLIGLEYYVVEERNADVLALVVEACFDVYNLQSLHNAHKLGTEMQDSTVSLDSSSGFTSVASIRTPTALCKTNFLFELALKNVSSSLTLSTAIGSGSYFTRFRLVLTVVQKLQFCRPTSGATAPIKDPPPTR